MTANIIFIDSRVAGYQSLIDSLTEPAEVFILDGESDGLTQMAALLQGRTGIDAIHVISHGSQGALYLGSTLLTSANLATYTAPLASIGSSLTQTGDILLYGCNVAQGNVGLQFINSLAQYTGADVAASSDATGAKGLGGDWVLESATGAVDTNAVLSEGDVQPYGHLLGYATDYELALMADMAYSDDPGDVAGWKFIEHTAIGVPFFAVVFQKGSDIVIAYRGTDPNRNWVGDAPADIATANLGPSWDVQFDEAIKFAEEINFKYYNNHISVTGHSLGGVLAQVAANMFGFYGATFDSPGAGNIVGFVGPTPYATLVSQLKADHTADHPDFLVDQGPAASFTNYLVEHSLVSGWIGDHIGRTEQLDFFAYATTEEFIINSATQGAHFLLNLLPGGNGYVADAATALLTTYMFHKMGGILDLMSIKAFNEIPADLQQRVQQMLEQASDTGDVPFPGAAYNSQTNAEYQSTSYNPYVFADDGDNTIYGTDGGDAIYSFAGNDTVYAYGGNNTINTARGNDAIYSGAGNDTVYAGSGNDVISTGAGDDTIYAGTGDDVIDTGLGNAWVDGGAGFDTLTVDLSDRNTTAALYYSFGDGSGNNNYTAGDFNAGTSFEALRAALSGVTEFHIWSGGGGDVQYRNVEAVNLTMSAQSELLIYQGGTHYDGGAGNDTFYADWSGATTGITWVNDPVQTQTVNGVSVSGLERLLLITGLGDDVLSNTVVNTDDTFIAGAGNDTLTGGAGNDTFDGGEGNDQAVYSGIEANYTVTRTTAGFTVTDSVGPDGTDTLSNIEELVFSDATQTLGKGVDLTAYSWKAHTLLDGVNVSAGTHSGITDATGTTSFTTVTDTSLTLTASRTVPTTEATTTSNAVNLQDAIAILKMIVGLPVNGADQALSPYQALAADFDGSGTVGLTDAIGVLKHVVGLSAPEPAWHFVNAADAGLATISISPLAPGNPPVITADLGGSSNPVQVELVGYLSGDVDGSFA